MLAVLMLALGIESGLIITIAVLVGATIMVVLVAFLDVKKWLIVALTALGGAAAVIAGIFVAIGKLSLTNIQAETNPITSVFEDSFLWTILWVVFGVVGIVYQARNTKDFFVDEGATFYHRLLASSTPSADEPVSQDNQLGEVDDPAVGAYTESAPGELAEDNERKSDGEVPEPEIVVDDEAEIEQDGEDTIDKEVAGTHEESE